jgi:hypothetical protein
MLIVIYATLAMCKISVLQHAKFLQSMVEQNLCVASSTLSPNSSILRAAIIG